MGLNIFKNYLFLFEADFDMSAVGTSCSPGRIQRIGPSFDSLGVFILTAESAPHGITCLRKGSFSRTSSKSGK
jgi:hypothetical protein